MTDRKIAVIFHLVYQRCWSHYRRGLSESRIVVNLGQSLATCQSSDHATDVCRRSHHQGVDCAKIDSMNRPLYKAKKCLQQIIPLANCVFSDVFPTLYVEPSPLLNTCSGLHEWDSTTTLHHRLTAVVCHCNKAHSSDVGIVPCLVQLLVWRIVGRKVFGENCQQTQSCTTIIRPWLVCTGIQNRSYSENAASIQCLIVPPLALPQFRLASFIIHKLRSTNNGPASGVMFRTTGWNAAVML